MSEWWNARREVVGADDDEVIALLRWSLEHSGVHPSELARRLGWKRQSVDKYLKGGRPRVGWSTALRWFRACGLRVILDGRRDD